MTRLVDVSDIDKAKLIQCLYNTAAPFGMGYTQFDPKPMTYSEAQEIYSRLSSGLSPIDDIWHRPNDFMGLDYLKGRCIKVSLKSDAINPYIFDSMYGYRKLESLVAMIRASTSELLSD